MESHKLNTYVRRILKAIDANISIVGQAANQLNDLLNTLGSRLAAQAVGDVKADETLGLHHIQYAVKMLFPDDLKKKALEAIDTAKSKFDSASKTTRSKASRAGLFIPPASAKKFFTVPNRKSKHLSIALAAVLEYVVTEILTLAANYTRDNKKIRIKPRALMMVVAQDEDLKHLVSDVLNFSFSDAGEVPHIHQAQLPVAKPRKRRAKLEEGQKRRARPGTTAIREIRKLQKTDDLLIQKEPIRRLAKACAPEGVRFAKLAISAIHSYTEQFAIDVLKRAQKDALHAKRVRVSVEDIHKAEECDKAEYTLKASLIDELGVNLKKGGLVRLARRAGVKTMTSDAIDALRILLVSEVWVLIQRADTRRVMKKRATIDLMDVEKAEEFRGMIVSIGVETKKKKKKASPKAEAE